MIDAEHHIAIHLDEAAIGVVGESAVGGAPREPFDGLVVEAEIEHRVHHARHRGARARAHRYEQRIVDVAETGAGDLAHHVERLAHHRHQSRGQHLARPVIGGAHLGRDGEPWRHRKTEPRHLGKVGALAAEQVALSGIALGAAGTEGEHPMGRGVLGLSGRFHHAFHVFSRPFSGPLRPTQMEGRGN